MIQEIEPRPATSLNVPLDYERRTLDSAEEALTDIGECDGASILIKWDAIIPGLPSFPILYILFRAGLIPEHDQRCKRVHLGTGGLLHPAHAVLLVTLPKQSLLEGQKLKDVIREGVEQFLRSVDIRVTHLKASVPLVSQGK